MKPVHPIVLLALSLLAVSCAKQQRPPANSTAAAGRRSSAHDGITGRIQDTTKKLLTGPYRLACDDQIEPMRQEIAAAIDARADQILEYKKNNAIGENYKAVPFGPTFTQERITAPNPADGWQEDVIPFSYYVDFYNKAKASGSMKDWSALNDEFRGMLLDEEGRIVKGYNNQVAHELLPAIQQLSNELEACRAKSDCTKPDLSEAARTIVEAQLRYKQEFEDITNATDAEKARKELADLADFVKGDLDFYKFTPRTEVKRTGENSWTFAVDAGPFAPAAEQYKRYFNELWQAEGGKVQLEFRQQPDLFRTILGDEVGGRSKVRMNTKEIILMPGLRARTVAHELGHVLGFMDNYFSVFNPADCSYKDQSRADDLMSNSSTGHVLPEHWDTMREHYK